MDTTLPIYTEKNDCKDCYKCVRFCPVKAIKVEEDSASIIDEQCIHCGICTLICPTHAKKVRNDLNKAQNLLLTNVNVIASIAPSYISDFDGITPSQMITALKTLGFNEVSETALGAEIVSYNCRELLKKSSANFFISSACPSVVELIEKYYPEYNSNITPLMSPMAAHGKLLKNLNSEQKIIFISPCVAKKVEVDREDSTIDVAITFRDLKEWFAQAGIDPYSYSIDESYKFYPENAASAAMYPMDGGMINSIKSGVTFTNYAFMAFSGIDNIKKVLHRIDEFKSIKPVFLELLACEGGCINGPGTTCTHSLVQKRYALLKDSSDVSFKNAHCYPSDIVYAYNSNEIIANNSYSENEIKEVLQSIGKLSDTDELNCGGCGYNSCRDFVIACLDKKAEHNMCVSYMRQVAHNKAHVLLQKMPSGVVMVNEDLIVIESNKNFAKALGSDMEMIYDVNSGLEGADLRKIVPFYKLFKSVLSNGDAILEKDLRIEGRFIHLSIFTIQKNKVVCGLFRDMSTPEVRREEVVKRTQKVIKENLSTVQQIAFLLGENASRTESMLNSIVDSFNLEYDTKIEQDKLGK
ncbi:MAG: 4Fe-4S binding protein [Salinivirgaceae bacterium]|nr:4Fe-4S binding protein [Salinivirgaceae bacterium]